MTWKDNICIEADIEGIIDDWMECPDKVGEFMMNLDDSTHCAADEAIAEGDANLLLTIYQDALRDVMRVEATEYAHENLERIRKEAQDEDAIDRVRALED